MSLYHTFKFWLLIFSLSFFLSILAIFSRLIDHTGNLAQRISGLWARLLCKWNGVKVEVVGMENIRLDKAHIFVANHQSFFDIFALSGYLSVPIIWVAKASLFRIPFLGWAMKAAGYISVERENRKMAYKAFLKTIERVKAGYSVVIFPEGTRSEDGSIGPFKKGSHLLAQRSNTPMVPVTIVGSGKIIKKGSGMIKPGGIRIVVSAPVSCSQKDIGKGENILAGIRDTILRNYEENLVKI